MSDSSSSILALVPNWLGDVVMCTPALRALRHRFPDAQLAVAGPASACQMLAGLPWISHFLPIPHRTGVGGFLRAVVSLRGEVRDLAVIFPHSFRAALLGCLAKATKRVGYARGWRSALLTDPVETYREQGRIAPVYMATEYIGLVKVFGCEDDGRGLELVADAMAVAAVKEHLVGEGPFVGIAPGAAFGPSKCWPAERYANVVDTLAEHVGAQCVLLTGPGEKDTRDAVRAAAKHPPLLCDEGNPSIASLKASISQLDLLICNDSGPRHVAVAFGVPTVCIMGPTSPVYSAGPYERGHVLRVEVDCGPCQKPTCTTDHRCMTRITPETVVEAALAYLPKAKV